LYRLLHIVHHTPQTREALARRLHLTVRGFYRDLLVLRNAGIELELRNHRYALSGPLDEALARLPLPDPHLNLGEAQELARGRGPASRKLRKQLARIIK
jgi:hypothetical protein